MQNITDQLNFVNNQLRYHTRQIEKLEKKEGPNVQRALLNHKKTAESFEALYAFLNALPDDGIDSSSSSKNEIVSSSLHILPSDIEGLPKELLDELNLSESDNQELEIMRSLEKAGGCLSIDKLMIQLYRDTKKVYSRKPLAAKLYRMVNKGLIKSNQEKRGAYELIPQSEQTPQSETKAITDKISDHL